MAEATQLELAPLPREQIGPFLLLGVDKAAAQEACEASWAERLKMARRQQAAIALEDINWARDVLRDPERRLRADAASLNTDLEDLLLARLAERFAPPTTSWQPIDVEPVLSEYRPAIELPDIAALWAAVAVPAVPQEFPAVLKLFQELVGPPSIDPWDFTLPAEGPAEPSARKPLP